MLTPERTKELLDDPELSDREVQEIKNAFYSLADLIIDSLEEKQIKNEYEYNGLTDDEPRDFGLY